MKLNIVLVFVFNIINVAFLDALNSRSLRLQISGVCTKSQIVRKMKTQVAIRTITSRCANNNDISCVVTKNISYIIKKPVTEVRHIQVCCPGYRKAGSKCEPICTVLCENGFCTQPNFCTCTPQYRKISAYHCAPICNDCHHGICIYPNECKCFANYARHLNGTCVPVCKEGCINAECTSPDKCSCHEGYTLSESYPNICTPICNLPCGKGGICHEPDVCLCNRNYRVNETNQCEPVCNTCENGVCTDPGVCVCNENYNLVRNTLNEIRCETLVTTTMEPFDYATIDYEYEEMTSEYDGIPNEIFKVIPITEAESDETTTVYDDIQNTTLEYFTTLRIILDSISTLGGLIKSTATPEVIYENETDENKCDEECVNGECVDGDCLCIEGYYESELIPNHCDPICEFYSVDGCVNGTCVAPNTCECYDGHEPINDHVCVPLENRILVMDHQHDFVKPDVGIKNLARQLLYYLIGTLGILLLVTVIIFIIYKWHNRRFSYHLDSREDHQFGAQYMAEDDGCEL